MLYFPQLARNAEVQDKLREELESNESNGAITFETLNEMQYLDQVLNGKNEIFFPHEGLFNI